VISHEVGAQKAGIKIAVQDAPKVLGIKSRVPVVIKKIILLFGQKDHPAAAGYGAKRNGE